MKKKTADVTSQGSAVLVVEDDLDVREALADALRTEGYAVATAKDGVDALDCLEREGRPSLVLVDVRMPRMNGLELVARLRATRGFETVPICVFTAEMTCEVPAADYLLRKPVDLDQLLSIVDRHLPATYAPHRTPSPRPIAHAAPPRA